MNQLDLRILREEIKTLDRVAKKVDEILNIFDEYNKLFVKQDLQIKSLLNDYKLPTVEELKPSIHAESERLAMLLGVQSGHLTLFDRGIEWWYRTNVLKEVR